MSSPTATNRAPIALFYEMHREHIPCLRKTIQVNDRSSLGAQLESQYEKVGRIAHFYTKPSVAVVELSSTLNKGDKIVIKGSTTDIEQTVDSIEIEHKQIPSAQAGQSIGMKVNGRVRENDIVYRVKP